MIRELASRTGVEPRLVGVAAVKEKRSIVIQGNLAAWMALTRSNIVKSNQPTPIAFTYGVSNSRDNSSRA